MQKQATDMYDTKDVLKSFIKFTGNHLRQRRSGVFIVNFEACNFIKKETLAQVFSCEISEISKSTFFL